MMSPAGFQASAAALLLVLAGPATLQGQPSTDDTDSAMLSMARVRPVDKEARKRHALEFAAMPEIKDGASQTRAYRLMGAQEWRNGSFETEAALEAGRIVARELKVSISRSAAR